MDWFSIDDFLIQKSIKEGFQFPVSDYRRMLHFFQSAEKIIKCINKEEIVFSAAKERYGIYATVKSTPTGMKLRRLLNFDISEINNLFQNYQLNPYVQLLLGYHDLLFLLREANSSQLFHEEASDLAVKLNDFVDYIKRGQATGEFKKKMGQFKRLSNKNYRSLSAYIDGLFKQYSKLLVLRVDLGYRKEYAEQETGPEILSYCEVKTDHTEFLRSLNKHLEKMLQKKGLVGYAWKLEFAPEKSWHYHMLFFLDGQASREDVVIARLIGEYWEAKTRGNGLYYNCNARKESYTHPGVGLIDHRDVERRNGLLRAVLYLTKSDYYIKMVTPDNGRAFGKGELPKSRNNHAGRRRQPVVKDSAKTSTSTSVLPLSPRI